MNKKKAIVNLKFKSNLSIEDINKVSRERKEILKKTKGLISLFCYTNDETKIVGGTFIFENIELAHQYLGKFMTEGLGPRYGIIPMTLKIDIGSVEGEIIGGDFSSSHVRD
ncbi:hypothetical protein [Aquimarina rubra]|uniref:Uncharacterized protein n=1 Tax=Aquimarina rubra TaxID=1920033 RepID=A0ABW5LKQ8_9FLAO